MLEIFNNASMQKLSYYESINNKGIDLSDCRLICTYFAYLYKKEVARDTWPYL